MPISFPGGGVVRNRPPFSRIDPRGRRKRRTRAEARDDKKDLYMATSKLPIIRASSKYNKLTHNDFRARLNAVLGGTFDNAKFPTPPVDKATFSDGLDTYGVL